MARSGRCRLYRWFLLCLLAPILAGARGCEVYILQPSEGDVLRGPALDLQVGYDGTGDEDTTFLAELNGQDVSHRFQHSGPDDQGRYLALAEGVPAASGPGELVVTVTVEGLRGRSVHRDVNQFQVVLSPDPSGEAAPGIAGAARPDLAFDENGNPQISFHDQAATALRLAWYDPRYRFRSAPVAGVDGEAGEFSSIQVAPGGEILVAYHDPAGQRLMLLTAHGLDLQEEVVDDQGDPGRFCSLILTSLGEPMVAYHEAESGLLKLAIRDSGSWTVTTVDGATNSVGRWASLAVAPDGKIGVAYHDETEQALRYAEGYDAAALTVEVADPSPFSGQDVSLAFDSGGEPWIVHQDGTLQDLLLSRRQGLTWSRTVIHAQGATGFFPTLLLDPQDRPWIPFYDLSLGALRLAWDDGSGFQLAVLDGGALEDDRGRFARGALAPDGALGVCYLDAGLDQLLYTRFDLPARFGGGMDR